MTSKTNLRLRHGEQQKRVYFVMRCDIAAHLLLDSDALVIGPARGTKKK